MKMAGSRLATGSRFMSSMVMPMPRISRPPTAVISVIIASVRRGRTQAALRVRAPW
jgi:hypothetical protein